MLRGLLLLVALVAIAAILWSFFRRATQRRPRESEMPIEISPHQLPALVSVEDRALPTNEVFARFYQLAFEVGSLDPPQGAAHAEVATQTNTALDTVSTDPRYAPRRPMLLPQLLRAVNDTDVSRRELSTIIARDPALAGSLLKLANSPFYRANPNPVESIDRAVALLGTDGIRSLVATAIMQPVFRATGGAFTRFPEVTWGHTYRAGAAAEAHAALVENSDPFAAQLLALVTGLGSLVVFRAALDTYANHHDVRPDAFTIASLLDARTPDVSRRIAASWDLSGRMLAALEDQGPQAVSEPTSLGRSLSFGRLAGALAVLRANGLVDDESARASLLGRGASSSQVERIWARLTGQPIKTERGR